MKLPMIEKDISIAAYNTFGLDVKADFLVKISSVNVMRKILATDVFQTNGVIILGGGSNILFTENFAGLVIKNEILGREIVLESEEEVVVRFGAGENWHQLVLYAIQNGWGGIENLSLIPGTVGAAPMQNIGAYGVEIKDVFIELEALNLRTGALETFDRKQCSFGYRSSIFKQEAKGKYLITHVSLRLTKTPVFNTSYGAIGETLAAKGVPPSLKAVSDAVIAIRSSKLPDPVKIGNAGSFFKNPSVKKKHFEMLKMKYPDIVGYELPDDLVKVPAGWLIEQAGWKGKRFGDIGVHKNQALVLVNYGRGSGSAIKKLAEDISQSVKEKYNISLEPEVNIV